MTRDDPILGLVRRCQTCAEWWPQDPAFYGHQHGRVAYRSCNACRSDLAAGRAIPRRPATHGHTTDWIAKRARDCERKAELRRDPILGEKLRARQRASARRYYWRNAEAVREANRARYAARNGPVKVGYGRPRAEGT